MTVTGSRKLANPKWKSRKSSTQFCIDGVLVVEVLKKIPDDITIVGARVNIGKSFSKKRKPIPNTLKRLGVQLFYEHMPANEAIIVFDLTDKKTILKSVAAVAKEIDADPEAAWFKYLTLDNGEGSGKFVRTKKDIKPYDEDKRRKLTVLGLTEGAGKTSSLVATLNANKYECKIQTVEVRTVICSELKK